MKSIRFFPQTSSSAAYGSIWQATAFAFVFSIVAWNANSLHGQSSGGSTSPVPCTSAENRQFDFWVGRWDVYPKKSPQKKIAQSLVEKLYSGCAIRENWMPIAAGGDGGSLNSYRPENDVWRQTWADSSGAWVEFTGKWNGTAMVLDGIWPQPGHPKQRTRMTYTALPGGGVEQLGESSNDDGKSWQASFDLIYRPALEPGSHT